MIQILYCSDSAQTGIEVFWGLVLYFFLEIIPLSPTLPGAQPCILELFSLHSHSQHNTRPPKKPTLPVLGAALVRGKDGERGFLPRQE